MIAHLFVSFFVNFIYNRLGPVVNVARVHKSHQSQTWFLSLYEICTAQSKSDSKHLSRLPRTSATWVEKICANTIRSRCLCCQSASHRAVVVVAAVSAEYTWKLTWTWSLSQQKAKFGSCSSSLTREELSASLSLICGVWVTISSLISVRRYLKRGYRFSIDAIVNIAKSS